MSVNEMLMAAAGQAGGANEYVEDCFATHLYTGTGASQTITNGIDLAGKGGLTWIKSRSNTQSHYLIDSERGISKLLNSNNTFGQGTDATNVTAYNSNGFTVQGADVNASTYTYASWTFRKAPKFFDVVTYTGNGVQGRTVAHSLGSVPGMIIIKRTNGNTSWAIYHRSLGAGGLLAFNTSAASTGRTDAFPTTHTDTTFSLGTDGDVNASGQTYVAYLFAHDAGGFGDAGTDNIISCGSFTTDGSGAFSVNLGYEPQWVLVKAASGATPTQNWWVIDNMRGFSYTGSQVLRPNTSGAEDTFFTGDTFVPTATGFSSSATTPPAASTTYIYMAIRRPMKKPTSGTDVFHPASIVPASPTSITTNFPVDLIISAQRDRSINSNTFVFDRLRGGTVNVRTNLTNNEITDTTNTFTFDSNTSFTERYWLDAQTVTGTVSYWNFRRSRGFFDIVCYTGTGAARTITHNLGTVPELMIVKRRDSSGGWQVYSAELAANGLLVLNSDAAATTGTVQFNATRPTASVFSVGTSSLTNASGGTYVAYLFDSVAGVSKIGTYTGNGTNQTINCGFSAGARFVLIKRTDSTGDWTVFDTARGIVSGNDPSLTLNTTAAEQSADSLDPANSGFIVNQEASENLNVNAATYIFLAIA